MAEKSPPAYQRYVRDDLSPRHKSAMNLEEWGAYDRLRLHIWEEKFLDFDEKELAKILRITPKKFRKLWPALEKVLHLEDGKITDPELDEQRLRQAEWRAKSAEGGRRSAESRRKGGMQGGSTVVQPNPNTSTSTTTSTTTSYTPPTPSRRDEAAKEGVGVSPQTKFSIELRREYRDAHGLGNGWLVKSETGKYDTHIEEWIRQGKPDRSKPRRSKYATEHQELAPNRFAERARQRRDEQVNRSVTAEPSPPVEPQRNGAPPLAPQGATASEHSGEVVQHAPIEPRGEVESHRPDDLFDQMEGLPS